MTDSTTKHCSKCNEDKPTSEFSKDASSRDGLQCRCKQCWAQYYQAKREQIAIQHSHYYRDHREQIAQRTSRYRNTNRDHVRQYIRQSCERWRRAHRDNVRAMDHRRRARKLASGGTHTATDVKRQGESQKWHCWWCGDDCKDKYHVDHMIPLARGGHNGPGNIVIACPHCNLSKNDKLPDEWIGKLL